MHQQLFDEWLQALGQLSEEHPEVFQHTRARQLLARRFGLDAGAIDQVQLAAVAQQVVQVQIFLPEALGVHLRHCGQGFAQHQVLFVGQHRQVRHLVPGIGQAFGAVEELEQQPATLTFLEPVGKQLWRCQALFGQQLHTLQLTLKMARSIAAYQQLGQHRRTSPYTGTDIALARQYAQQAEQLQFGVASGVGQADRERQ
ncbi:hypothetical protein D3C78_592730 [compost metagenome]